MSKPVDVEALVRAAQDGLQFSYCPYSEFHVSAALWCADGSIIRGVNVENVSYGLAVCAERTAIFNAVSNGHTKFLAMAICSSKYNGETTGPCGACRQVLAEFGMDLDVYMVEEGGTLLKVTLKDLLPKAFTPESLPRPSR